MCVFSMEMHEFIGEKMLQLKLETNTFYLKLPTRDELLQKQWTKQPVNLVNEWWL